MKCRFHINILLMQVFLAYGCFADQGWRKTFSDEFNGKQVDENPACYGNPQQALCTDRYWSTKTCADALGAAGVDPDLNTCNWVVMNHMNWMYGSDKFNAFDAGLVEVKDGYLSLPARRNPSSGSCGENINPAEPYPIQSTDCPVLSGAIWSRKMSSGIGNSQIKNDGFAQKYGRFEIRAKIPTGQGSFPAHWLLPQNGGWPEDGEIDIMEYTTSNGLHGTFHGGRIGPPKLKHAKSHKPNEHYLLTSEGLRDEWHVYAIEWTPTELRFFVDDIHYGTMTHQELLPTTILDTPTFAGNYPALVPQAAFFIILNTSVMKHDFPSYQVPDNWAGLEHKIDYVRVYESCELGEPNCDVLHPWKSKNGSGKGKLGLWNMSANDQHFAGDFDADGHDELLSINAPWVHLHEPKQTDSWEDVWHWLWGSGSGSLAYWNLSNSDIYLVGNFKHEAGQFRDELLAINKPWAHLMRFNGSSWAWEWGSGISRIGSWNISKNDRYLVGDFDGQGTDEILAINANYIHMLNYSNNNWQYKWRSSNQQIQYWYINPDDRYLVGDFNNDGKDDLLAIRNNWAQLMTFNGSEWEMLWSNNGNGMIHWWYLDSISDNYLAVSLKAKGDYLIANKTPWSHAMKFSGSDWVTDWSTFGAAYNGWFFQKNDKYIVGDWVSTDGKEILAIHAPHWQMIDYLFMPAESE